MLFGNVNRTGHTADSCRNFNCDLHYVINRPASDYRQWYLTAASFINTFFAIKEPWKASAMEHNSLATQKLIRLLPATCCPATPQRDQTRNAKELFGFNRKRCTECFWISSRTNSFAFSPWTSLFYFFKKKKKKRNKKTKSSTTKSSMDNLSVGQDREKMFHRKTRMAARIPKTVALFALACRIWLFRYSQTFPPGERLICDKSALGTLQFYDFRY